MVKKTNRSLQVCNAAAGFHTCRQVVFHSVWKGGD